MMIHTLHRGMLTAALALVISGSAHAAMIYGTAADYTGSRSVADGELTSSVANWDDAVIEWQITSNGDGTLHYKYTFKNFGQPDISHITLDLSDDAIDDEQPVGDVVIKADTSVNAPVLEFGDKDGIVGAVKFEDFGDHDAQDLIIEFDSDRLPVWGDINVEQGQSTPPNAVQNTAFGDTTDMDPDHFVARPNGEVPEPATFVLITLGAFAILRRR
jgi:hypothetical protein